jgi:putative endonuclease
MAADHVAAAGCVVMARNLRTRFGEADLLVRDGEETVLIEVKARAGRRFGTALEAVDRQKLHRMRRLADYLGLTDAKMRFDVITVEMRNGAAELDWLKGVF